MRIDLNSLISTGIIPGIDECLGHWLATIRQVVELLTRRPPTTMVETGCQSTLLLNAHGMSTTIFGALAERHQSVLHTVDNDLSKLRQCQKLTREYAAYIRYTFSESVNFLAAFQNPIDFLYLDSYDFSLEHQEQSRQHQLAEIQAAYGKLSPGAVVLLDDANIRRWIEGTQDLRDSQGKTTYAHRFLLEKGACCLVDYPSYQRLYKVEKTPSLSQP